MDNSIVLPSKKAGKNPNDITSLRCRFRLKDFLAKHGNRGESDEDVVWRLLGLKTLTKEQSQEIKSAYETSI